MRKGKYRGAYHGKGGAARRTTKQVKARSGEYVGGGLPELSRRLRIADAYSKARIAGHKPKVRGAASYRTIKKQAQGAFEASMKANQRFREEADKLGRGKEPAGERQKRRVMKRIRPRPPKKK